MGIPKIEKHLIKGMQQDIAKSKFSSEYAYEIRNVRLLATDSQTTFASTNERGNKEYLIGELKGYIIGHCEIKNYIVLFTHDSSQGETGKDYIYRINILDNSLKIILEGNMNFSLSNKIETIGWFESSILIKIYWIDGINQPRYINIADNAVNSLNKIDFVPEISFGDITVEATTGGLFTAGQVQYGYNLYNKYGAETKLSGLSELHAITTNGKGSEKNSLVSIAFNISVSGLSKDGYNSIRLYRVHRTEANSIPKINLIYDNTLSINKDNQYSINFTDNGQSFIEDISLEQISFLGSDFLVPKCIAQHSNRLLFANYREDNFNVKDLDIICDRYPTNNYGNKYVDYSSDDTRIFYKIRGRNSVEPIDSFRRLPSSQQNFLVPATNTSDAVTINPDYVGNIQSSSNYKPYGSNEDKTKNKTSFKRGEKYRFGIQFCNKYGQWLEVKYLQDIIIPRKSGDPLVDEGSLTPSLVPFVTIAKDSTNLDFNVFANYVELNFTIPSKLTDELKKHNIVKARIVRVKRTSSNSTILSQGIVTPTLFMRTQRDNGFWGMPDYLTRSTSTYEPEKVLECKKTPKIAGVKAKGVFAPLSGKFIYEYQSLFVFDNFELNASKTSFRDAIQIDEPSPNNLNYCMYGDSSILTFYSPEVSIPGQPKLDINSCSIFSIGQASNEWTNTSSSYINTTDNKNTITILNVPGYEDRILTYLKEDYTGNMKGGNGDGMIFSYDTPTVNKKVGYFRSYYGFEDLTLNLPLSTIEGDKKYCGENNGTVNLFLNNINKSVKFNSDIDIHYTTEDADQILTYKGKTAQNIVFSLIQSGVNYMPYLKMGIDNMDLLDGFTAYNGVKYDLWGKFAISTNTNKVIIAELQRNISNQYGSTDNNVNTYIPCSDEIKIEYGKENNLIANQGDIYLQRFNLLKSYITDTQATNGVAEGLSLLLESTINLDRRYDTSEGRTDIKLDQPAEYYKVNEVYNQQNDLFTYSQIAKDIDIQSYFPNKIIASSTKISGSKIDKGTNILQNEFLDLDGKYGEIQKIYEFNSFMYGFQDTAVSYLLINPRVQIMPSDGVPIELGTGQFLQDKRYISTKSGTTNKWGVTSSSSGIYYIDDINSSINKIAGEGIKDISTEYGFHAYMSNVDLTKDFNSYYHHNNDEIYFNFKDKECLIFNEAANAFTEFVDISPNVFISYKDSFITDNIKDNKEKLYIHFEGDYNKFYGELKDSSVTIISNENYDLDKTYDNVEFRSECYSLIDNKWEQDVFNETYNYIQSWNERQDSKQVPLIYNSNLKERFRIWRTPIPRQYKSLTRMRNGWQFIKLGFNNKNNRKVILHDINIKYSI